MKINSRYYILVILAIISITVTSLVYVFIYKKTIKQAQEYVDISEEIKKESIKKQEEKNLLESYSSTDESRTKIESFFVNEEKILDFINMVERVGTNSKTEVELSSISNMEDRIKVTVSAKGSWGNIMTALSLLENLPLSNSINNIRLDSTSSTDKAGKSIYYWTLILDMEVLLNKTI